MLVEMLVKPKPIRITRKGIRGELISNDSMKALVDRIDWANCLQCNHNNWDDCVEYAMKAAEYGVIGCEYLKFNDKNDSRDGTIPSPT